MSHQVFQSRLYNVYVGYISSQIVKPCSYRSQLILWGWVKRHSKGEKKWKFFGLWEWKFRQMRGCADKSLNYVFFKMQQQLKNHFKFLQKKLPMKTALQT